MTTFVWIYEKREAGRPIGLRLVRYDKIPEEAHILSARFSTPDEAAAGLGYYLEQDMAGHAIVNERREGRPIGWSSRFQIALNIAPLFVGAVLAALFFSMVTFALLLIHVL